MKKSCICFLFLLAAGMLEIVSAQNSPLMALVVKGKKEKQNASVATPTPAPEKRSSYEATVQLGWLSYKAGSKNKSVDYYIQAMNMQTDTGTKITASQPEDLAALLEQDKNTLMFDPGNKIVNQNIALIYYYAKHYTDALPYLQKIAAYYPFDYNNNLALGWTLARLGNKDEAAGYFRTALLHSPGDVSATDGLALINSPLPADDAVMLAFAESNALAAKLDYKGAIAALKEVYDASSYFINLRLGELEYLKRSEEASLHYYKIAAALKPASAEPRL